MTADQSNQIFVKIKAYYESIPSPKYRNVDLGTLKEKFDLLQDMKNDLGHDKAFANLVNAMSQIIAKLVKAKKLANMRADQVWSNLSERGTNKVIPFISKCKGQSSAVEWTDRWGNTCSINKGHWGAKHHIVMDVVGYLFLLKEGGDCLPKNAEPLFSDLFEIQQRENQLNGNAGTIMTTGTRHYVRFNDDDFRKLTGLKMNSTEILTLLLETARVEFKLTFPVRFKYNGKENIHKMNFYSRFFEIGHEDLSVKSDGKVLTRRYTVVFNTLLGELFVNNLLVKYSDPIDNRFYQLPDSAQSFYRRALIHNNFKKTEFHLATIAEYAGLTDTNPWNLVTTVETSILRPLIEYKFIDLWEKVGDDPKAPKYIIYRFGGNNEVNSKDVVGSVKDVAGSVKDVVGSVKR